MEIDNYRLILKRHLAERIGDNPKYSLRAFSRDLGISPSRLSEILNGKQGLSYNWAKRIATSLQMNPPEQERFCQLVLASDGRAKGIRQAALSRLEMIETKELNYRSVTEDTFNTIADWYHFAILELTKLKSFKSEPAWIAKRLAISEMEAKLAIERLLRLNLLQDKDGSLKPGEATVTTTVGVPSEAIRKFNKQVLDKAKEAISTQAVEERDFSTLTLAVRRSDIPVVVEKIKKFRRELNAEMTNAVRENSADEVYSLGIQFCRLTNRENV